MLEQKHNSCIEYMSEAIHTYGQKATGVRAESNRLYVVATTRPMSNSSTNNKSQGWISSGEHELCNSQENLTVKFTDSGLGVFYILLFIFIFILFYFLFSIFRTARVNWSRCHISHNLMA